MKRCRSRGRGAAIVAATCWVLAACTGGGGSAPATMHFEDSRVDVVTSVERGADGTAVLATFRPTEAGLHLYAAELPRDGIDGAGRPTLLELVDSSWMATGPLVASVDTMSVALAGFDQPFPIYPDGPVTLRLPVRPTATPDDGSLDVAITFMACSSTGLCYLPQIGYVIHVPD